MWFFVILKGMKTKILNDLLVISFILALTFVAGQFGVIDLVVKLLEPYYILAIFVSGFFFTSVFTTIPAIALLAHFGSVHDPLLVAFVGASGSLLGDALVFRFFNREMMPDMRAVIAHSPFKKIKHALNNRAFRFFITSLGAIVIASPLPDEIGLALMGISRVSLPVFIVLSYTFNMVGIYAISLVGQVL